MTTADGQSPTFDSFAPYYDAFTAGYQAERWTGRLADLAERVGGISGRRLLDVGCGTGKSAAPMIARGWEVVGSDVSEGMLEVARERLGGQARLEAADVRDLPTFGAFDLVWALNDTLNNMLSRDELRAALEAMGRNLAPGGVALFDLNTELMCRAIATEEEVREVDGFQMRWTGLGGFAAGGRADARFELLGNPAATHVHRQRHFPEAEAREVIAAAGLECLGVWGDYEGEQDQPLDEERHQKAIYLARLDAGA